MNGFRDRGYGASCISGQRLDALYFGGHTLCCLLSLGRECLDLIGDHREAATGLSGTRRLNGGIERQKAGAAGDRLDEVEYGSDLERSRIYRLQRLVELVGLPSCVRGHGRRRTHLLRDLCD